MSESPVAQKEPCSKCGELANPVHRATDDNGVALEEPSFKGWFCAHCGILTKPIWRERKLEMPL